MTKINLPFRQVHLDFHTSEHIANVGAKFDPDQFARTLQKAHVNSINLFARCHHGYIYFNTKKHPERRHPSLKRNLLKEQIEACHKYGIKAPIYTTVQWDHFTAMAHPEWLVQNEQGASLSWGAPVSVFAPSFQRFLCLNTPYVDFLKEHTKEILTTLPVDGFWYDIIFTSECSCQWCRKGMEKEGMDPANPQARKEYAVKVENRFKLDLTRFIRKYNKNCLVFYNSGHVGPKTRASLDAYSHLELESLPSGNWGYQHYPTTMRYARTLGKECLGMTGKFHTAWGDFHSFKNKAALEYECFRMLALGGKSCVGDQLHPSGKMCKTTYNLIGSVFSEIEKKEPWCKDARPMAEIAVLSTEEHAKDLKFAALPKSLLGVTRMLQESAHQFDILDSTQDFSRYKAVILPDEIPYSKELDAKIRMFGREDGAIIASHKSGLLPDGSDFGISSLGVKLKGDAPYSPDFLVPKEKVAAGLDRTEYVMYKKGLQVQPTGKSEVLANVVVPYFNRTREHFCSHMHAPSSGKIGYPGIVKTGRTIYFAHPIFAQYQECAPAWCKRMFLNALNLLLPQPLVRTDGPSTLLATMNEQPKQKRRVLHLLHYIPERRSDTMDIIENVIPLHDVRVSIRADKKTKRVTCVPQGVPLSFVERDGRCEFVLPRLLGHQLIAIE